MDLDRLGSFYLGRLVDPATGDTTDVPYLYDSRDLTTHAVCVGMTGSGKTGLGIGLLEEAALDGIPSIVIDPKGDLANLLLTFPELRPGDFRPWIDEGEATRTGRTADELAQDVADRWRSGLAEWGQDGARIARMREAVELRLLTPGSTSGRPVSVLRSLSSPPPALLDDPDAYRERVASAVSGLLTLVGVDADPVTSREHILLSRIVDGAWRAGRDLDLGTLIREIQTPGFERMGVLDLESFFPAGDRSVLAFSMNNLLASPAFAAWFTGEPLDASSLLYAPDGRPRVSVLSIAHLGDAERMFFVTLLLNEVVSWMRSQEGSSSLRAILYMDELFGFLPPVANPPSKQPLLTLLKQARAFGLGVVLATQNPVDLDYKAISNAGTWYLGRLQTEQDKARLMDGLDQVGGGGLERRELDRLLSGLDSRVFVARNIHEDETVLFRTRWAMSYMRGPLTRSQVRALAAGSAGPGTSAAAGPTGTRSGSDHPPILLPSQAAEGRLHPLSPLSADSRLVWRPAVLGRVRLHWVERRMDGVDHWEERTVLAPLWTGTAPDGQDLWERSLRPRREPEVVDGSPDEGGREVVPAAAGAENAWKGWGKGLEAWAYRAFPLKRLVAPAVDLRSEPGEAESAFRIRVAQAAREVRDRETTVLRDRFGTKIRSLENRIRAARQRVEREEAQLSERKMDTAISVGTSLLGAFLGGRRGVGRTRTALRSASRISREKDDVDRAEESLEALEAQMAELVTRIEGELEEVRSRLDPSGLEIQVDEVAPRKSDLETLVCRFVWVPFALSSEGIATPLVELPQEG